MENWKQTVGYPYSINEKGEIKSGYTNKIMSTAALNGGGYNYVTLFGPLGKHNFMVHRLVAIAFIPNPENKEQVNHIDGNKRNNHVSNLEWVDQYENMKHAVANKLAPSGEQSYQSKLTEADVLDIRIKASEGVAVKELCKSYGVNRGAISGILLGENWKHVGGPLKERANKNRLSAEDIPYIRQLFKEGQSDSQIGELFEVARGTIQQIRSGKNWSNY